MFFSSKGTTQLECQKYLVRAPHGTACSSRGRASFKTKDGPLVSIRTRELERKEVQKKNKNKTKFFVSVKAYEKSMPIFMETFLKNVPAQQ